MSAERDEFIPTRTSLLRRVKNPNDHESWKEFDHIYRRMLYAVATRSGLSHAEAEDIVQDIIVTVTKKMPDFQYDPAIGSFKSWLMLITRRRLIDHFRKRGREPKRVERNVTETARTATLHRIPDPAGNQFDEAWEDEFRRNVLEAAVAKVKDKVDSKQFQMFDCSALKGWPVPDIAKQMKVTPAQIYTAKHRVGALIKEEVRRLETKMA